MMGNSVLITKLPWELIDVNVNEDKGNKRIASAKWGTLILMHKGYRCECNTG